MRRDSDHASREQRFRTVFSHIGAVTAYARRRGSRDPDAIGAEVMTVAWRRLAVVPRDDPRPWLYATARNLLLEEARRSASRPADILEPERVAPAPELEELDPDLAAALRSLSPLDQEALLLVAWEDLTPSRAAETLGISSVAFRVRLLRARRRLRARLERPAPDDLTATAVPRLDVEET